MKRGESDTHHYSKIQIDVPHEHTEMLTKTIHAYREACNYLSVIVFQTKALSSPPPTTVKAGRYFILDEP
ncbi:hypothetical protein [Paenibacillus terreus]|uniref:hypothetical protein n=1 Tax=Paenibacillus terreus TaxID=1387834 RepID=UPI0035CCDFAB